jgi:hypothetical protein
MNLALIYIAFTFAGGLPILLPILLVYLFVTYNIDKYLVIYYYRKPEKIGPEINETAINFLLFTYFSHLVVSMFMYSNSDVFPEYYNFNYESGYLYLSKENIVNRLTKDFCLPITAMFSASFIIYFIFELIVLCKNSGKKENKDDEMFNKRSYDQAKTDIAKESLNTFNIYANKDYRPIVELMNLMLSQKNIDFVNIKLNPEDFMQNNQMEQELAQVKPKVKSDF